MIDINLLPTSSRKKKNSPQTEILQIPKAVIIGLVSVLVVLLIIVHIILLISTLGVKTRLSALEKTKAELASAKKVVDGVKQEIDSIEKSAQHITSLRGHKKISWAKKLNLISDNMVRGAWLTRIYFAEGYLKIEGSAVSKKGEEMINVGRFAANLKEEKDFYSEIKSLELTSIQRRNIKTIEVVDFVITAGIKE